ncbi:hypothetical protein NN3_46510 [Nocardia neocaledoniensis NBRC 108232]|nr:hypothetical protein NN3_46510 [Nocardia neocaledoniensis NBRC 108232]
MIAGLGFRSGSRHRTSPAIDSYRALGCTFDKTAGTGDQRWQAQLTVWSVPVPLQELARRVEFTERRQLDINGREAFGYRRSDDPSYSMVMVAPTGTVGVTMILAEPTDPDTAWDRVEHAATAVEAVVPPM